MNLQINKLVKSLLQKDTLEQCSLQELEQFADRNPYFGAAQLLLTKKLQIENHDGYEEQLQKTFLYFHNPLWVEQLLNETGNAQIFAPEINEVVIPEPVINDQIEIPIVVADENKEPEPVVVEQIEIPLVIAVENKEPGPIVTTPAIQPEQLVENIVQQSGFSAVTEEPSIELPALKIDPPDSNREDTKKEVLLFEPFYTVDYFASQGIKFKEEEKPKDKFGQQLKSFTDWLKTMKRLPVSEIAKTGDVHSVQAAIVEKNVEQMAEHSLEEGEVVTEAMAEVWEKQGNMAKAMEVYSKLSLIYPSKSPYFAAKIDDLKKTN